MANMTFGRTPPVLGKPSYVLPTDPNQAPLTPGGRPRTDFGTKPFNPMKPAANDLAVAPRPAGGMTATVDPNARIPFRRRRFGFDPGGR